MANDFLADARTVAFMPWRDKTVLQKAYTAALILLAIAVLPVPFAYYASMRLGICACLYYYYREANKLENLSPTWKYGTLGFGLLYNPILPIHLGVQMVWTFINVATLFFLYRARLEIERAAEAIQNSADLTKTDRTSAEPDWSRKFALYFVASEFFVGLPDEMPRSVVELITGNLSGTTQQALLVELGNYLSFAYGRDRTSDDYDRAIRTLQIVLRTEIQTGNSRTALERFLRRMHTENGTMTISEHEFSEVVSETVNEVKSSDEFSKRMRAMILRDCIEELFAIQHGKSLPEFQNDMTEAVERADA